MVAHLLMSPQYNQWITDLQAKLHKTRSAGSTPEDRLSDSGMRSGTLSPLRESPSPETTSEGAAQPKVDPTYPMCRVCLTPLLCLTGPDCLQQIESETSGSASPLSVMHSRNSSADLPATAPSPLTLPHSRPGHSRGNSIVDAIFGGFQGVGVMSRDAPGPAADMEEPWQGEEEWCNLVSTEPYHFTGTFTDSAHQGSQSKVATFSVRQHASHPRTAPLLLGTRSVLHVSFSS